LWWVVNQTRADTAGAAREVMHMRLLDSSVRLVAASLFSFGKEYDRAMIKAFPVFSSPAFYVFMNSKYPKLEYTSLLYGDRFFVILGKSFPKRSVLTRTIHARETSPSHARLQRQGDFD
jgi:hypothetical protein